MKLLLFSGFPIYYWLLSGFLLLLTRLFSDYLQYVEDDQLSELLQELSNLPLSLSWSARHGSILTISSMLRHNPSVICTSPEFPSILDQLKSALTDEKVFSPDSKHSYIYIFYYALQTSDTLPSNSSLFVKLQPRHLGDF